MKAFVTSVITMALVVLGVGAVIAQSGNDLFQQALVKERTNGDMAAAIALYQTIVDKHGSDRALVLKALMQMGQCYEKLGRREAVKVYERVAREFADHAETVATVRTRLAALMRSESGIMPPLPDGRVIWGDASLGPATISPDGRHLVYVSPGNMGALYVRDLRAGLNRRLTIPAPATDPGRPNGRFAFSPDGTMVAYGWQERPGASPQLRLIALDGTVLRVPYNTDEWTAFAPRDWSPDGRQILGLAHARGISAKDFVLVSVADGSVRILKRGIDVPGEQISRMTLSRDGRYLAYDHPARNKAGDRDIFIIDVEGGQEMRLVARPADDSSPIFTPDGRGIFFVSARPGLDETWFLRVVDGKPQGSPELLDLRVGSPIGFTQDGSFVHVDRPQTIKLFAATLDTTNGTIVGQPAVVTERTLSSVVGWSPDGQFLAYVSTRSSAVRPLGERIIVIRTVQSGDENEIAPGFRGWGWSADGRSVLADGTDKEGRRGLYRVDARTADVVPLLHTKPDETLDHPNWFGGGKSIVFIRRITAGDHIVVRDLETARETELYRPPAGLSIGSSLEVSADGQHLGFVLEDPIERTTSVMVMTATDEKPRELRGSRRNYPERIIDIAALTPDGRYVLCTTRDVEQPYLGHRLWQVSVDGRSLREVQIQTEYAGTGRAVFHPDGKQFAFTVVSGKQAVRVNDNVLPRGGGSR